MVVSTPHAPWSTVQSCAHAALHASLGGQYIAYIRSALTPCSPAGAICAGRGVLYSIHAQDNVAPCKPHCGLSVGTL